MEVNINKGAVLGAFSGITVFIITLLIIMFSNSDFDQQLIVQVDGGLPADKLIPQIDKETQEMKLRAQKRYNSNTLNSLNYNERKGDLASPNDYNDHLESYNEELKMISNYDEIRKKYAKREITKEQFLNDIINPKYFLEQIY